jgi:hypothetical protein
MKADEYGRLDACKKIAIYMNPKYPVLDVYGDVVTTVCETISIYGDAGWDCASFTNAGLKELVEWLKENKPELFK